MAFSATHQKTPVRDTGTFKPHNKNPSNTTSPSVLTWVRIAQPERVSLVHTHRQDTGSETNKMTYFSRVWRVGRSPGSVLFDVSPCPGSVDDVVATLMKTLPDNRGNLVHREGQRVSVEINLRTQEERDQVINHGIPFTESITIRATPALDKHAQVVKIRLTQMPLLDQEDLEYGLRKTLGQYGTILDVGINRDPKSLAYMGNGYATLDIQPKPDVKFEKLDHPIPWCGDPDDLIYAHFDQMTPHCSKCHQPDHVVANCPKLRRNQNGCFKCKGTDHYITNCPLDHNSDNWLPGGSKNSRRKIGHKSTPPSKELQKSIHASPKGKKSTQSNRYAILEELSDSIDDAPLNSVASAIEDNQDTPNGSSDLLQRGYLEQMLDEVAIDFIGTPDDMPMIEAEEQEEAARLNPPADWLQTIELSDPIKELIETNKLENHYVQVLFFRLTRARTQGLQEYEEMLLTEKRSGSPGDPSANVCIQEQNTGGTPDSQNTHP